MFKCDFRHAKRTVVSGDDVKLVARRSKALVSLTEKYSITSVGKLTVQ